MKNDIEETENEYSFGVLKSLIGLIPWAGGLLNEIFFEARGRLKQNRINSFIEELGVYMQRFTEKEINVAHINSEDFSDFFEEVLIKISKTNNSDRIRRFKELLGNQMVFPLPLDFSQTFLELIEKVNEKQILILKNLYELDTHYTDSEIQIYNLKQKLSRIVENWENSSGYGPSDAEFEYNFKKKELEDNIGRKELALSEHAHIFQPKTYDTNWDEFLFLLQDLSSKSLVVDTSSRITAEPFSFVEITNLGRGFIDFIEHQ